MRRPGRMWCLSSFLTAPYAVRPPQASAASSSPTLSGSFTSDLRVDAELLRERAHDAPGLGAVPRVAAQAVLARPAPEAAAGAAEPEDDPVADRDVAVGARAELGDDADALVAERHAGRQAVPVAAGDVQVGVAHPRRAHPDQRLVVPRRGRRQVLDLDLSLNESCCSHAMSPRVSVPSRPSMLRSVGRGPIVPSRGRSTRCHSRVTPSGRWARRAPTRREDQ